MIRPSTRRCVPVTAPSSPPLTDFTPARSRRLPSPRQIGVMGISAVAPIIVTAPSQIPLLYVWQVPIWLAITAAGFFVIKDRPEVGPPSAAAAAQWEKREQDRLEERRQGKSADVSALEAIWADTQLLLNNRNFLFLCLSFSLLTGIGWTFLTVVGQILEPCGFTNEIAGLADAVFMVRARGGAAERGLPVPSLPA